MALTFFDGEIWIGRGNFKMLVPIFSTKYKRRNFPWHIIRYIVFDCPRPSFIQTRRPFELRYEFLLQYILQSHPFIILSTRLKSILYIKKYIKQIVQSGGEGVMIRKPNSPYEHGRSYFILKYKVTRDGEALVVGKIGEVYKCKLPSQLIFRVAKKSTPEHIKIGTVVTYKCINYSTSGIPLQAVIFRKRSDITWEDVLVSYYKDKLTRTH